MASTSLFFKVLYLFNLAVIGVSQRDAEVDRDLKGREGARIMQPAFTLA